MKTAVCLILAATVLGSVVAFPQLLPAADAYPPCHDLLWVRDYSFAPYVATSPYGKLNVLVSISKLNCDGSAGYDWYFYNVQVQSVPGWVAYGSDYRTEWHGDKHTVWSAGTARWLADYDPTTANGYDTSEMTASVTVSDSPQFSFTKTDSFTIPWVRINDYSDYSVHRAQWNNDFNKERDTAMSSFQMRPWFVVKTTQNSWSFVDAYYEARFAHLVCNTWFQICWWEGQSLAGTTRAIDAQRTGDV